jgi:hypothetical protein
MILEQMAISNVTDFTLFSIPEIVLLVNCFSLVKNVSHRTTDNTTANGTVEQYLAQKEMNQQLDLNSELPVRIHINSSSWIRY